MELLPAISPVELDLACCSLMMSPMGSFEGGAENSSLVVIDNGEVVGSRSGIRG